MGQAMARARAVARLPNRTTTDECLPCDSQMFSILESVAFDTGYAGSNGIEPQSWVNGNGTSYIYFGSGQFDGQGSGHDFSGTVCTSCFLCPRCCVVLWAIPLVLSVLSCKILHCWRHVFI